MAGKISSFFREYVLFFSVVLTVIGFIVFFIGFTGIFFKDVLTDVMKMDEGILPWCVYLLIIGFVVLITGLWYLYSYLKNRKFILKELETNKRSEFIKKHAELKNIVKHMPSKFQKMVKEKEESLNLK